MICTNCGTEIPDESKFCPNCGHKNEQLSGIKMIHLTCSNCQGTMDIDPNEKDVTCPYCGHKIRILDSDTVAVEKIKKEIEFAKMANENEKEYKKEKKEEQRLYKESKLCKATIIFTFICLLMLITSFKNHHFLSCLIAIIQIGLFGSSWLMGMQIIKEKRKRVYIALAVLGFLLIIPFLSSNSGSSTSSNEKLKWPEKGIATKIPDPESKYGDIMTNDDEEFYCTVKKYSQDKFDEYVEKCKNMGYENDSSSTTSNYTAFNDEGYKIDLSCYTDSMIISLDAPIELEEYTWPESDVAKLLPKPESKMGKMEWEYETSFLLYVGNTSLDAYKDYVQKVMDAGFTVDYNKGDNHFYADNKDGYSVEINYEGNNVMRIKIEESTDD